MATCDCGRSWEHAHYSRDHDLLVRSGLLTLLTAEAISFIKGYVQSSTTVNLSYSQIAAYDRVTAEIAQMTGLPIEFLKWFVICLELLTIVSAIVAVGSLHSVRNVHVVAIAGMIVTFILGWVVKQYQHMAFDAALAKLPGIIDAETVRTALYVQTQFEAKYGFWGSGADLVNALFSYASLALFVGALITSRRFTLWQPWAAQPVTKMTQPQATTQLGPAKFCRYCGARIPRDSLFCEECGKELLERSKVQASPPSTAFEPGSASGPQPAAFPSSTQTMQLCSNCGKEMRYSWQAKKWICDTCQLSRDAPAPPEPPAEAKERPALSAIASGLAIFGLLLFGGIYLEIPAVIIAGVAVYRHERGAWASMFVCLACLVGSLFLAQTLSRLL